MADVMGPTRQQQKNVHVFEDAFEHCYCPTCGTLLDWQPPDGIPWKDSSSENEPMVEIWHATCPTCQVQFQLEWFMQRPSDHTTAYGYIKRVSDIDEDGR